MNKEVDTPKINSDKLKIAIQKSGRLYEDSMRLLKDCGIDVKNGVNKLKRYSSICSRSGCRHRNCG
jgi:hypothetical protein